MKIKVLVLGLVFSLLVCSGNLAAKERQGAELAVQKKDGQQIRGELIAVKPASLLLLDSWTGADVSVEIGEIAVIKIIKKSKALTFAIYGFGVGTILGLILSASAPIYIIVVPYLAVGYAIVGMLLGAMLGADRTIQFERRPQEEIKAELEKLRRQARIADFQ